MSQIANLSAGAPGHVSARDRAATVLYPVGFLAALLAGLSPALALGGGLVLALFFNNPWSKQTPKISGHLLKGSVVLLGFGMDPWQTLRVGAEGSLAAAVSIAATLACGYWLGRRLGVSFRTSALISAGTAICGGSAIAAVAATLGAASGEVAVALGTVFVLNALALYVFPWLGHLMGLGAETFGFWAGMAIHDLSSVVGASSSYGLEALQVATAVKLSRTLWIVPVCLTAFWLFKEGQEGEGTEQRPKVRWPLFIVFFLAASLIRGLVPEVEAFAPELTRWARSGLTAALFLIGAGLTPAALRQVGWRPFIQGACLWLLVSALSLGALVL